MHNTKKIILLLMSAGALSGLAITAESATWRFTPSLEVTESYTDNVDLDATIRQSDFVTQVSPQFLLTAEGARLTSSINYTANYLYYPGDANDKNDLRHNLAAEMSSELISDTFFIEGFANINQRFVDRRDAITITQVSRTNNRRTIQTYGFSPYLTHAFGAFATAELRYNLRNISVSSGTGTSQTTSNIVFGDSLSHQGSFALNSGRQFKKLTWSMSAFYKTEQREVLPDYRDTTGRADFSYLVNNMFSLLGSVGYQKRDAPGSIFNFKGFIWDAGFRLTPGPRASLSFRYGNQYNGNTFSLNAQYKITSKNSINLSYTDFIQTFQAFAIQDTGAVNFGQDQIGGFISGDLSRRKRWALSVNSTRGKSTYSASMFFNRYSADNTFLDERRYGGVISINRRLNSKLTVDGSFTYNSSRFTSDGTDDKFWSALIGADYRISKSLTGSVSYIHTNRSQRRFAFLNGGFDYVSLSIRAAM